MNVLLFREPGANGLTIHEERTPVAIVQASRT
jgi:hypothetical protein